MKYRYKTLKDQMLSFGTSKILNTSLPIGRGSAQFRGALLALFGQPTMKSQEAESAYDYVIEATDEENNKWILNAYEGPSGPAIGGNSKAEFIIHVANDLLNLIESTEPADFEEVIIYSDFNTKIIYGCKDGVCYFHEEEEE